MHLLADIRVTFEQGLGLAVASKLHEHSGQATAGQERLLCILTVKLLGRDPACAKDRVRFRREALRSERLPKQHAEGEDIFMLLAAEKLAATLNGLAQQRQRERERVHAQQNGGYVLQRAQGHRVYRADELAHVVELAMAEGDGLMVLAPSGEHEHQIAARRNSVHVRTLGRAGSSQGHVRMLFNLLSLL